MEIHFLNFFFAFACFHWQLIEQTDIKNDSLECFFLLYFAAYMLIVSLDLFPSAAVF